MQAQEKAPAFPAPPASKNRLNLFRIQMETLTPSPLGMHVIVLKVNSSLVQKKRSPLRFQVFPAEKPGGELWCPWSQNAHATPGRLWSLEGTE